MTLYKVEISQAAEREMIDALDWYQQRDPRIANRFSQVLFDAVDLISRSPFSWNKVSERGVRRYVLPKYPYSLFFHVDGDVIRVLSLNHHHRMPRDWQQNK